MKVTNFVSALPPFRVLAISNETDKPDTVVVNVYARFLYLLLTNTISLVKLQKLVEFLVELSDAFFNPTIKQVEES